MRWNNAALMQQNFSFLLGAVVNGWKGCQSAQCFKRPRRQVDDPVLSPFRVLRREADDPLAQVELFPTQAENLSLPQPVIVGHEQDGTKDALGSLEELLESLFRHHDPTDVGLTEKLNSVEWVAREIAASDRVVQDAAKQGYLTIQSPAPELSSGGTSPRTVRFGTRRCP